MITRAGTEGTEVCPYANTSGFCLVTSYNGNRPDWLSFRDSSADSSTNGSQEISWVERNTSELYNCRRWTTRLVLKNSSLAGRGICI